VALVEFTERAEKSLLEILGKTKRLEESLLVVEMGNGEAQLSVKTSQELTSLQQDIDLVGPFRVALGGAEVPMFVREIDGTVGGRYELDYYSCGGRTCFQIRERLQERLAD
jgi:hypothetical protein